MFRVLMIILSVLFLPVLALAQAASQPASQPVTPIQVQSWFNTWLPVILAIGVPLLISVINALSKYTPKATGLITFLKILVDVFSFWGNKDSKTNATVPFLRSRPPGEVGDLPQMPPSAIILVPILALTISSCCVFKGTCEDKPGQVTTAVVNCAKAGIEAEIPKILPIVIDLLKGASFNTDALIAALGGIAGMVADGIDVVTCAVEAAVLIVQQGPASQPKMLKALRGVPPTYTPQEVEAVKANATIWMLQKKVRVGTQPRLVTP